MELVSLAQVQQAAESIRGVAVRTPLLSAPGEEGFFLKPECLQPTGAFKLRGAQHALARMAPARRAAGVVTHSSGNHAQALAYAARGFGVPCVVVMPDTAPPMKIEATRELGAEVVLVPPAQRLSRMQQLAAERGLRPIPPFDHPDVIAGQGTVGLEILAELPSAGTVLVPVGGGGLASGVATAVKALSPATAVIGVEPELAADAADSLRAGHLVGWPVESTYRTIADALRVGLGELTFAHLHARLDAIITVTEAEILATVGRLARGYRLVTEPGGAVAAAGYLYHRDDLPAGPVVAVVSGGNVDPVLLVRILSTST